MAKPLKVTKVSLVDPPDEAAVRIMRTRLKEFYSHWPDPDIPLHLRSFTTRESQENG